MTCGKTNHSREKIYFGADAPNRPPPETEDREDRFKSNEETIEIIQKKSSS